MMERFDDQILKLVLTAFLFSFATGLGIVFGSLP